MITNQRLFEVLTRHQIYVEGVKAQTAIEFNKVMRELDRELIYLFSTLKFPNLDALTKGALRDFLIELKEVQTRVYSKYTENLVAQLKGFMEADVKVSKSIFATLERPSGEDEAPALEEESDDALDVAKDVNQGENIFPIAWFKGEEQTKLWSAIANAPIPANGILPLLFIAGFTTSAMASIENIVRKGYANRSTVAEVLAEIRGTSAANNRDGALSRINMQSGAVTATIIQHITAIVQAGIASVFYRKYRWISVIDGVTTEICKGRNKKIFVYGKGPLPPAHIRCRSKVIPLPNQTEEPEAPQSYFEFMKSQPNAFQNDILGPAKAEALRSGKTKQKDMQQFSELNPLSLAAFIAKLKLILKR